jgi:hypothetical protein
VISLDAVTEGHDLADSFVPEGDRATGIRKVTG